MSDRPPFAAPFTCQKRSAQGSRAMVVTNHPLASAAGAQMLLAGGNAIDAAVAALFSLTVVEPMMVGILGGGLSHVRLADGRHRVIDGLSTAASAARPDMYEAVSTEIANYRETRNRANEYGALAVAVPGALAGWCELLASEGTVSLSDALEPAIRYAANGFEVTPYLATNIESNASVLANDDGLAAMFLPGGHALKAGDRIVQSDYAQTLRLIASEGANALYTGELGTALTEDLGRRGGIISAQDLSGYRSREREVIHGNYRGFDIFGPPPPASSGVHITQMLNILEGFDVRALGFGTTQTVHLMAEALSIAFADRSAATADPDFVDVSVDALIDKAYAQQRREQIHMDRAGKWQPGLPSTESANTTHVTVADAEGNIVATTHTINGLFGACVQIAGTGMLANNYMFNFDPHPGNALSIEPGKRVFTSMAPMIALRDGEPKFALGLPGGLRIFPSAFQAIVNLIDHGMTLQQAVEAPRIWTEGGVLELEEPFTDQIAGELTAMGHQIERVPRVAGGMNAVAFEADGGLTGAACWRADGTPVAISGGLARAGVGFSIH